MVGCSAPLIGVVAGIANCFVDTLRFCGAAVLTTMAVGCSVVTPQTAALRTDWPRGVALTAEVADVPFYPQQGKWCGPASLASMLNHAAIQATPDSLADQVFAPGLGGSLQVEMVAAARRAGTVAYTLRPHFADLLREVAAGHPVLVLQDNGFGLISAWHYAIVVGYDYAAGELFLRSGHTHRLTMPFTLFEASWRRGNYWSMVVLPPDVMPATANEEDMLVALLAMAHSFAVQQALAPQSTAKRNPVVIGLQAFLARWPANELGNAALANVHYAQQELSAAEGALRMALRHLPHSIVLRNNLAQILVELYRCKEAQREIDQLPASVNAHGRFGADIADTRRNIAAQENAGRCLAAINQ